MGGNTHAPHFTLHTLVMEVVGVIAYYIVVNSSAEKKRHTIWAPV